MTTLPFLVGSCGLLAVLAVSPASGALVTLTATLSGTNEVPPNNSPGTGFVQVDYDPQAHTLFVQAVFSGLLGTTTAAHIHSPAAPGSNAPVATQVPTFVGFPLGVTSGSFMQTLDLTLASSWNVSFINSNGGTPAMAEAALAQSFANGTAYFNIHTSMFPGGEIRGNLQVIPAPLAAPAGTLGLALIALRRRRRSL